MSIKYTKELLNSYCQEHNVKLLTNHLNEKIWCEMSLEGNCTNNDCVNTFKKSFKHLIKNGWLKIYHYGKFSKYKLYWFWYYFLYIKKYQL
jgi:predicted DNA-binding protein (MmcQ/YjbR family)